MSRARAAIILAAGQGTRMKSALPKVLHPVGGRPMLDWAIAAAAEMGVSRTIVVTGAHSPQVGAHAEARLGPGSTAIQDPPLGTAHAVLAAKHAMAGFEGDVVVLYADAPLVRPETLAALFATRERESGIAVLAFRAIDPTGYGRLILGDDGKLNRIVEQKDANADELKVDLCNSGVLCADARVLFELLANVKNENAKGEYYLTDVIALGRKAAHASSVVEAPEVEMMGVNSRVELAEAEAAFQKRAREAAMLAGVTMIDPASVFLCHDTELAPDVVIEPNVFFGPKVKVARGARIKAFCHIEGAEIGEGANVGPSARLRPGTKLGAGVKIGNFVEIKNATFAAKAQASHLTYVGDADVGARANLGCGTITCNYDGFDKYRTTIGEDAFIGSDTALVAPVTVGARAYTGSGSVITKDVPDGALAVTRAKQVNIEGWADANRAKKQKAKEQK
jgi:bifunctional UDP-N-acetylglucosamine pyrophosphorylase/glucosamine-1-phosphate N-acetyltransferase